MIESIAVFCGSHKGLNPRFEEEAQRLGSLIAQQGSTLVYGGSNLGHMGTVSAAALQSGGKVIGIIPTLFSNKVIYSQPGVEVVVVSSMAERKEQMIDRCDAFVALPGGIGTLDEISEVMVANQLHTCHKPMGIVNVDGFFDPFLQQLETMIAEGLLHRGIMQTLLVATSAEEVLQQIATFGTHSDSSALRSTTL